MHRVAVITGTRAEYGLLRPVMERVRDCPSLDLQTIVTGAHLDPRYGETWREIEADGFTIDERVPILGDHSGLLDVVESTARALSGIASALSVRPSDAVVVLGDRYESFAATAAAYQLRIPVAHIGGGEVTTGALDDGFRHAMTKLSHWHFVSTTEYAGRVLQMGEDPSCVHTVGALGLDAVLGVPLMSLSELEASINFELGPDFVLCTFHPVTLDSDFGLAQLHAMLGALERFDGVRVLFTMPNADPGSEPIIEALRDHVRCHPDTTTLVASLGQRRYLSAASLATVVVGNSSSGIIEVPALGTPTVNIGSRQGGRLRDSSVIDCEGDADSVTDALTLAMSPQFVDSARRVHSLYGDGHAAERIVDVLVADLQRGVDPHKYFRDLTRTGEIDAG